MNAPQEEGPFRLCCNPAATSGRAAWYEEAFCDLYPVIYRHRDDASAAGEASGLIRIMGLNKGDRLLDVCCGHGRHMQAFADAGLDVFGIDLSGPLLGEACARPAAGSRLVRADMRALPFVPCFDAVVNLFTSFGYFDKDEENEAALSEMARVLRPGGVFVIDHMNRSKVERDLVPEDSRRVGALIVRQHRWIEGGRVLKRIEVLREGAGPVSLLENVRMFRPEELVGMMQRSGLGDIRFHGSFNGDEFNEDSERMIVLARKGGG